MKKFKLTVIIVNWNTRQLVLDCLDSIYSNYINNDWNIVVVDNNSHDNSADAFEMSYPNIEVIRNKDNIGFAAANNQILKRDDSDFYLLLNSDTYVIGDVLQKSLDYIQSNENYGVMGCRVLNSDKSVQYTCSKFPTLKSKVEQVFQFSKLFGGKYKSDELMTDWHRDSEREVDVVTGCYLLIRNTVIQQVGILDEDFFFFGEETDWCYRIKKAGWKIQFSPVGEIVHYGSFSAQKLSYKRDLMLSGAIVRFFLKNRTKTEAVLVYAVMFCFNVSRALVWIIKYGLNRKLFYKQRASLFLNCVLRYHKAWPTNKKGW